MTVPLTMMPPSLPIRMVAPTTDTAVIGKYRDSLAAAERSFSDEAQKVGLGAAFEKFGHADAINMGGPKDVAFVVGSDFMPQLDEGAFLLQTVMPPDTALEEVDPSDGAGE